MPQDDPYSFKHYGVLGMHWGIRKEEYALGQAGRARNRAKAHGLEADLHSRIANRIKGTNKITRTVKTAYATSADRKRAKEVRQEQIARRWDKAFDSVVNKPYHPKSKQKYNNLYHDAIKTLVIGTGGSIAIALARPTVDIFGKKIASYVGRKTPEYLAKKALGG